jgi:DNA polymerase-3 subunit delta'
MIRGPGAHAVLLLGPAGIGKTTLALDLAAGLLCTDADPGARPCRVCRACRLVDHGSHPDVHWLGPEGPGRQVVIGGPDSKWRGVRDLIGELALMPVEGGARVAIIERASRMNDDAQAALLKSLEEPPAGVTIVLCADAEEPLLPTIRSRCARLRLGPVAVREIEAILADAGVAEAPLAARLARISGGRPGVAMAWATDPEALLIRDELARTLLDLTDARPSERLAAVRGALGRAMTMTASIDRSTAPAPVRPSRSAARAAGPTPAASPTAPNPAGSAAATTPDGSDSIAEADPDDLESEGPAARTPVTERRRAAEAVVDLWTALARDLALEGRGVEGSGRELALLDETAALARDLDPAALTAALDRLGRAAVLLATNVAPELVLDDLALAWPRRRSAAA